MKALSLFSGIGAASLAVESHFGAECVGFVEQDKHACAVLRRHWPDVPQWNDVREVGAHNLPAFDILEAGTPCQDLSAAGSQAGLVDGAKSALFFEAVRIAAECRPQFVFIENVPALLTQWRGTVEDAFAGKGYGVIWAKVAAAHVGAPHKRMRVFVLATLGGRHRGVCDAGPLPSVAGWSSPMASSNRKAARAMMTGGDVRSSSPPGLEQQIEMGLGRLPRELDGVSLDDLPPSIKAAWPTPTVQDGIKGGCPSERERNSPSLVSAAQAWATPNASDGKDCGTIADPCVQRRIKIGKQVNLGMQMAGKLSACWVETLQGLPIGWSALAIASWSQREEATRLMLKPRWPAPMVKGMWGDSPQHDWEPPRTVSAKVKGRANMLKALGNCNPPQLYLKALQLLEKGPAQASLFGLL